MDPREAFAETATRLVFRDPSVALVYAEISGQFFGPAEHRFPERVLNVGIREQLLVSTGAGLALAGMRPIVHTFASFLVERAFEQVKLDFTHQDVGGVLVSSGGSVDISAGGRTHQSPGDVALIDTLPGWTIHTPGHATEVAAALRLAAGGTGRDYIRVVGQQNSRPYAVTPGRFHRVREGSSATVVAVGPMLDPVLEAVEGLDVTVLYAGTIRPFDRAGLRAAAQTPDVILVEPYLAGTSAHEVSAALSDRPHRLLSLGIGRDELRRYGTPQDHLAAHGLDARGIRENLTRFLGEAP